MNIENITQEEQLSLNHIENLKKASQMSGSDILFLSSDNAVTVSINILEESKQVEIVFLENSWEPEHTSLRDYSYIMNVLILG